MFGLYDVVNSQYILSRVSAEDIFRFYGLDPSLNGKFSSPFRRDSDPSASFFYYGNVCLLKDFGSGKTYNCITFVAALFQISFAGALNKIASDMKLAQVPQNREYKPLAPGEKPIKRNKEFQVLARPFQADDYAFWKSFGIHKQQLIKFRVFAVKKAWCEDKPVYNWRLNDPCYAYVSDSDYKLYFPSEERKISKRPRFMGALGKFQGYEQLPEKGDVLVLTKSYKDVMLFDRFDIPSLAMNSESAVLEQEDYDDLHSRFPLIVSLYDFDYAGIKGAAKLKRTYGIKAYFFTSGRFKTRDYQAKDLTDFYKLKGEAVVARLLETFKQSV